MRLLAFLVGLLLPFSQTPTPQTPVPKPAAPDFSKEAFVIEQERHVYRFENDGTGRHETYVRVKTQSEAGVQFWGQLLLGYNAATEKLEIEFVRVHKTDGTTVTASADSVQDLSAPVQREAPMYTDFRQKHVTVPSLRPGETLEFTTVTTIHTPLAAGHFWLEHDFQDRGVNLDEQLEVDVPATRVITLKTADRRTPAIVDANGRRLYRWRSSHTEPAERTDSKDDQVADQNAERLPDVRLTTFKSWDELGRWYSALETGPRTPTPEIRKKALELTANKTTALEKIEALYDFVAPNFRYVSISLGAGRYQPRRAADVLRDQYGDCKDKHTLLASLIESVGLQVSTVLINSSKKIDPDFPSPSQFDHAITLAWADKEPVWLDTTAEIAPFRLLVPALRKKQALVVSSREPARLEETPADPPFLNQQTQELEAKLGDLGKLTGRVKLSVRGDFELLLRTIFRRTPAANWKDLLDRMNELFGIGGELTDWKVSDPAATKQPFEIEYHVAKGNFVDWTKKEVQLKLPLSDVELPATNDKKEIELGSPMRVDYRLRLEMEPGYDARAPMPVSIKRDYADYEAAYAVEEHVFTAKRSFSSRLHTIPADRSGDYEAFRRVVLADDAQGLALVLPRSADSVAAPDLKAADLHKSGYEALRSGNYEQAIMLLTRVVELEPKNKTAWINLGQAHMGLRQYDSAINAFKKQLEINPFDEYAYNNLGRVYALQRHYQEAESAFRKQLEVNPLDKYAHGALGNLYVEAKRYSDAVPELEKAISLTPDQPSLQVDLGTAHLNLNNPDKALASFARAAELSPTPWIWNNLAYQLALKAVYLDRAQQYSESALSAVAADSRNFDIRHVTARELGITQSIGSYLDTLGWVALAKGDLTSAEKLVTAAWWISEQGEVGDHLGQIAARRGRRDDAIRWYALALNAERPDAATRDRLAAIAGKDASLDELTRRYAAELPRLRDVLMKSLTPAAGTADFFLLIAGDGRVEEAEFTSGEEKMKPMVASLKILRFPSLAEAGQPIKVFRRGTLTCASTCTLTLIPAGHARPPR